jgi:hypothetical protein
MLKRLTILLGVLFALSVVGVTPAIANNKVWVCKYVSKPGVSEVVKNGNDGLIHVSANSLKGKPTNPQIGDEFKDKHFLSVVVSLTTRPAAGTCAGDIPPPPPPPPDDPVKVAGSLTTTTACLNPTTARVRTEYRTRTVDGVFQSMPFKKKVANIIFPAVIEQVTGTAVRTWNVPLGADGKRTFDTRFSLGNIVRAKTNTLNCAKLIPPIKPPKEPTGPVTTNKMYASIRICGDPRSIVTLNNQSNIARQFRVRFVSAKTGSKKVQYRTLAPHTKKTLYPAWVMGKTAIKVRGAYGQLLAKKRVNKRNHSGACPQWWLQRNKA